MIKLATFRQLALLEHFELAIGLHQGAHYNGRVVSIPTLYSGGPEFVSVGGSLLLPEFHDSLQSLQANTTSLSELTTTDNSTPHNL